MKIAWLKLAVLSALFCGAAHANYDYQTPDDSYYSLAFQSPSGNIVCAGDVPENHDFSVSCEIRERQNTKPAKPRPKDCDLEWGSRFYLDDVAILECHGDTLMGVADGKIKVLPYGETVHSYGGTWSCQSLKTGIRCQNKKGKGFEISRSKQRIF